MYASSSGHAEIVKAMLDVGADSKIKDQVRVPTHMINTLTYVILGWPHSVNICGQPRPL